MWVSHLGCLKGCLEFLGLDVSEAWLFGATGHAFIINIHEVVCPSGPTAWDTEMLFRLGKSIGYTTDGIWASRADGDFAEKQRLAWENTRLAIDQGLPCYGWELDIPEYYVIYGYDHTGYYFSGPRCDSGKGPKPWQKLGDSHIGVLGMFTVKPGKALDDVATVREALAFALEHSQSPPKWIFPKYKAGLAGYDNWIRALENGSAHTLGMAYNTAVWSECRNFAVPFLKEARERLGGELTSSFDGAAREYEIVAQNLKKVSETFPFPPTGDEMNDADRCRTALKYLRAAWDAEESALRALEEIRAKL